MNFNYSYRAFLITLLIFGGLAIIFMSIRLKYFQKENELIYEIEIETPETEEDEDTESYQNDITEIATNKAFNQDAEITRLNREQQAMHIETRRKLEEIDEALSHENLKIWGNEQTNSEDSLDELEKSNVEKDESEHNINTTVFYNLPGRTSLRLPNPVYTCSSSGKIVVTIEVNQSGIVSNANYNRSASNSSNQCLIDAALSYAKQAIFTGDTSKGNQLGTITFIFPGQNQ